VVTGLGLITPCGADKDTSWSALLGGKSGIGTITAFDTAGFKTTIAGEARDFDVSQFLDNKEARRMDRFEHMAVGAADMAVRDAALELLPAETEEAAVIVGSGIGGIRSIEDGCRLLAERGPSRMGPYVILQISMNLAPGFISIRHGFRGPSFSTSSACASGAHAIGEALRGIQNGDFDVAIAGASEAPISPVSLAAFGSMHAMSVRNDHPTRASRPFDKDRDGFVLGEGAAMMVLETAERALRRGARVYGELAGYGATSDAHHPTAPAPEHEGGRRSILRALRDAGMAPCEIDYVNAHATSTEIGDRLELAAIKQVFGAKAGGVLVSSTKSMTGHMLGAAGAAEAVISVLALATGMVPPTINLHVQDVEPDIDCVPLRARARALRGVLSNAFGFGGTNAALVFRALEAEPADGGVRP
jgi:3-oxoacyl-[acyl-carrier-protein] synthase II